MKRKRILSALIMLAMVLTLVPTLAFAAEGDDPVVSANFTETAGLVQNA